MQAVDLPAALVLPLLKNPRRQMQRPAKDGLELVLVGDLPRNIPDGAPEISLELAKGLAGALELMGVGVTLMPDQCQLADAPIGLAEIDPNLLASLTRLSRARLRSLASVGNITFLG